VVETISQLILNTVESYPKDDLMMYKKEGKYVALSTEEIGNRIKFFSLGLRALGQKTEDKLVILSDNRPEWMITDLANLCLGGITVPIYTSLVPEQIKYIVENSDARIVVYSDQELWKKIETIKGELIKVSHYITFAPEAPEGVLTFEEVMDKGRRLHQEDPEIFQKGALAISPADIASIIYTSGTTGIPKGVMLTHGNFVSNVKSCSEIIPFSDKDTVLSFLPLSHVLERMVTFTYLYKGCSIAYAESIETVAENLLLFQGHGQCTPELGLEEENFLLGC